MDTLITSIKRQPLVAFFGLVFALVGVTTLLLADRPALLPFALTLLPTTAALVVVATTEGRAGVTALLRRLAIWRVGLTWYGVVLGLPVLGALAIVGLARLLGAPGVSPVDQLTPAVLLVTAVALLPAMAEEVGWRGYALPRLLMGRSALSASLILGALWAAFHLPLFLPGQMYAGLPLWPLPVILIAYSVLFTWVFLHTRGSVLLISLFHAALNGSTPLTHGVEPGQAWELRAIVYAVTALILVMAAGPQLVRGRAAQSPVRGQPVAH
jgi:membrane protease YdiL (CAAX protease family)